MEEKSVHKDTASQHVTYQSRIELKDQKSQKSRKLSKKNYF